jgi:hypothetical protein
MSENNDNFQKAAKTKKASTGRAASRYAQLTPEKKAALTAEKAEVSFHPGLSSFTGTVDQLPYFLKAFELMKATCALFVCGNAFLEGFVAYCNSGERGSNRSFEVAQSQLKNGIFLFLQKNELNDIHIGEIDQRILNDFIFWLKNLQKNGEQLSENTVRKYYGTFKEVFAEIKESNAFKNQVSSVLVFPVNPFPDAHRNRVSTEVVDDVTFLALQRACVKDISEIITKTTACWNSLSGERVLPDSSRRGRGQYADLNAAVWEYSGLFEASVKEKIVPFLKDIRAIGNTAFSHAVQYEHGLDAITLGFFPTASDIFPFVVLMAIYSMANTGPLRSLDFKNISHKDAMGFPRIEMRFAKGRGNFTYPRTFAIDANAQFSPDELVKFIKKWTGKIRPLSGNFYDHLFIFATSFGSVRGFNTAKDSGSDSDSLWNNAANHFFAKHKLPKINLRTVRFTAGDIVRENENDDARAVQAILGQRSESTNETFYDASGAKRRRDESLAQAQNAQQRWARTGGKIDSRTGVEEENFLAATPGLDCIDPYDSPLAGEVFGRPCGGYALCPACPHVMVNHTRARNLARLVQLREEMDRAQVYLAPARWKIFQESRAKLDALIRGFTDPNVIAEAEKMELRPLAPLE